MLDKMKLREAVLWVLFNALAVVTEWPKTILRPIFGTFLGSVETKVFDCSVLFLIEEIKFNRRFVLTARNWRSKLCEEYLFLVLRERLWLMKIFLVDHIVKRVLDRIWVILFQIITKLPFNYWLMLFTLILPLSNFIRELRLLTQWIINFTSNKLFFL